MNETQPQLQRAPDVHTYHYPPPVPCTECGGAGRIALLVTARPCAACEGSGWIQPAARHEITPEAASRETRNPKLEIRNKLQGGKEEMEA
jgi:DnaJ-class molecular chaperone